MGTVTIIGGGLAGSEAAWQVASRGVRVRLHEMRPERPTLVHQTDRLAELVCSNSFRGDKLDNAVGVTTKNAAQAVSARRISEHQSGSRTAKEGGVLRRAAIVCRRS